MKIFGVRNDEVRKKAKTKKGASKAYLSFDAPFFYFIPP